jgi:1,4-dihydroxy-2-naphthoate octaprenyltransferase
VVIGQKAARISTIGFWLLQYGFIIALVLTGRLGPAMLIVLLAIPKFIWASKIFLKPRPVSKPEGPSGEGWPLYLVSHAFIYNRVFGMLFLLGLIVDVVLYKLGFVWNLI